MTHSMYRMGTDESLKNDYVFIARPAMGFNDKGCRPKLQKMLEILLEVQPTNFGSLTTGETMINGFNPEKLKESLEDNSPLMCCFSEREKVVEVLKRLKEEDLGISVTITGILEDVKNICKEVGLNPHSADLSLGIHGNTELLPEEEIMPLTTMCGHGMVAAGLVRKMKLALSKGKVSAEEAAKIIAAPCLCGIFNNKRAEKLLIQENKRNKINEE